MLRVWQSIILGLVFVTGVAGVAAAQEQATFTRPYWLNRSVIEVIGRARVDAPANRARFSVTFKEIAHEALDAQANAADRARLAVAAMRDRAHNEVQITSAIGVTPNYQEYRDHDGNVQQREGQQNVASYTGTVTLTVIITDTTKAPAVRAAAFAVGPEDSSGTEYYLDAPGELQRRVYVEAVADAAARARAAAQAAGSSLGPLLVLQEGQGPCLGTWQHGDIGAREVYAQNAPLAPAGGAEDIVVTGSRNRQLRVTAQDIARLQLPDDLGPISLTTSVCAVYAAGPGAP